MRRSGSRFRHPRWVALVVLLCALPLAAQIQVGDNFNFNQLGGNLGFGYSGAFGDLGQPQRSLLFSGDATLSGYYYNPAFISFDIQPYYNRSQTNSGFQSISNSSGFTATSNFFSGSHFPGAITYNRTFDGTGTYGVPGLGGYETHGGTQRFSITWSVLRAHWPTLTAVYSVSSGSSEVYGTSATTSSDTRNFTLRSGYTLKGFRLDGSFVHVGSHAEIPEFFNEGKTLSSDSGSNSYGVNATHRLPLRGTFFAGWNRYDYSTDLSSANYRASTNTLTAAATLNPLSRLSVTVGSDYSSNVFAFLDQQLIAQGGLPAFATEGPARSLRLYSNANYMVLRNLSVQGYVNHYRQTFAGQSYAATQYGGGVNFNYVKNFLGSLSFSLGAADTANQKGNTGAGFVGTVNFSRKLRGWDVMADASYSQNVQTLLVIYTTSYYGYGTTLRRRVSARSYWSNGFRVNHSGLTRQAGSDSHSESVFTSFTYRGYALNANYSQSGGATVLTPSGLTPVPTSVPLPAEFVLFNGKSFGIGASAQPIRRFTLTTNYSRASSETSAAGRPSSNHTDMFNTVMRWQLRKMMFNAGFTRFNQSISAAGAKPSVVNAYYIGISRWFSFF